MSNLTRQSSTPQMRCLPLHGRADVYRYVQMVNGVWVPLNHTNRPAAVGDMVEATGVNPYDHLTDGSLTSEASPSASSGGSQNPAALSTFAPIMNMVSASAPLTCSFATSRK